MPSVNPFDASIISWLNHWAHRSWILDRTIGFTASYLFRVAGTVPVVWWAWFRRDGDKTRNREILAYGMIACLFALGVARTLAALLPFRARPTRNPDLHFVLPYGQDGTVLFDWSSFPSDHAAVYFTLAMCIYLVSKKAGLLALAYTLFITCIPRVYVGLHYPTDILAGAAIGIGIACLAQSRAVRTAVTSSLLSWQDVYPGVFYAGFFIYALLLATAFEPLRELAEFLRPVAQRAIGLMR